MIPHIIHYCWFGGTKKPKSVEKCIASWKKACPSFEIREWNESNYDIHKHPYMEKAYKDKKWAFISDYARLDILYQYGGFYLDTDVEVIKDLLPLCDNEVFFGFERLDVINDGHGFGCASGLPIIREMLDVYDTDLVYEIRNGEMHFVESPKLRTEVLLRHGLKPDGSRQKVENIEIYPIDYFCPKSYSTGIIKITDNTYSIHHFDGSWHGSYRGYYVGLMRMLNRTLGEDTGKVVYLKILEIKDTIKKLFNGRK